MDYFISRIVSVRDDGILPGDQLLHQADFHFDTIIFKNSKMLVELESAYF